MTSNISEAWHKRRYKAAFVSKLNDAEAEAGETQNWLYYINSCNCASKEICSQLHKEYDNIIGKLVTMMNNPEDWLIKK